jgi:hypothetical protein
MRMRLLAVAAIVWLALVFIGRRYAMHTGIAVPLAFVLINPDRVIAQTVIGRWARTATWTRPTWRRCRPTPSPRFDRLPADKRDCVAAAIQRKPHECAFYLRERCRHEGNWIDPGGKIDCVACYCAMRAS